MGRLLGALTGVLAYVCVATVIAALSGYVYLRFSGGLDGAKLARLKAAWQGLELAPAAAKSAHAKSEPDEQPSYEERQRTLALQLRQLEMREQSISNILALVRTEQKDLDEKRGRYDLIKDAFRKELADVRSGVKSSGRTQVMQTLVSLKPKQAKEQLLQMMQTQEIDEVVTLLSMMPLDARAKIVSEFKAKDEVKMLDDLLRKIREAKSENDLVDKTEKQIQQPQ